MSTETTHPSPDLAVALTAFNSMRTIERTIESVRPFAAQVVVVDSGSTDGTIDACRALGAEVVHRDWTGHVEQKQFAIDQCRDHEWVMLLDSDESVEPDLATAVIEATTRAGDAHAGWELNRKTWFLDGWLHHVFQPEWRLRVVRPKRTQVTGTNPHDRLEVDGAVGRLEGVLRHDSWESLEDMCRRYVGYAAISAKQGGGGGGLVHLMTSPGAAFLKQYLVKRGFLDGRRGLIASGGAAMGALLKHMFIAEANRRERDA